MTPAQQGIQQGMQGIFFKKMDKHDPQAPTPVVAVDAEKWAGTNQLSAHLQVR